MNDGGVATNIELFGVKTSPREKNIFYKRNSVIVVLRSSMKKQTNTTEIVPILVRTTAEHKISNTGNQCPSHLKATSTSILLPQNHRLRGNTIDVCSEGITLIR